jgi:hypothetical protein
MRTRQHVLAGLLSVAGGTAHAQSSEPNFFCRMWQGVDLYLNQIEEIDSAIESVPPEEANYLAREYQAAAGNPGRLHLLYAHPYYEAWELHRRLGALQTTLLEITSANGLKTTPLDRAVRKINSAAGAMTQASAANEQIAEYVQFDTRRPQHVLTRDQIGRFSTALYLLPGALANLIRCITSQLPAGCK